MSKRIEKLEGGARMRGIAILGLALLGAGSLPAAEVAIGQLQLTNANGYQLITFYNLTGQGNGGCDGALYQVCNGITLRNWTLTLTYTNTGNSSPTNAPPATQVTFTGGASDTIAPYSGTGNGYAGSTAGTWEVPLTGVGGTEPACPPCDYQLTKIEFSGSIDPANLPFSIGAPGSTSQFGATSTFDAVWTVQTTDPGKPGYVNYDNPQYLGGEYDVLVSDRPATPPSALSISKSHTGNFLQGQAGATYAVTVSNGATAGPTSGVVTVTESVPNGMTLVSMSGSGWTCPAGGSGCTRNDALAAGASYPVITVTVNVAGNAAATVVNQVTVTGGGSASASATDSTTISPTNNSISVPATSTAVPGGAFSIPVTLALDSGVTADSLTFAAQIAPAGGAPALSAAPGFTQDGSIATAPTVNAGALANSIVVQWTALSPALSGAHVLGVLTGTLPAAASGGQSYVVGLASSAASNGGGTNPITVNAGANGVLNVISPAALSIAKTHTGNFTQGQNGATYSVTVSNGANAGPTSGTVTVTETVPTGMTLASMAGTGWTCPAGGTTCTRSDVLAAGASYPDITVTVNVATNATSPQVNSVAVSGGASPAASTTDSTTIIPLPLLSINSTHTGNFTQGQSGTYTVTVSNGASAGPTSGTVTVTETVPSGMTLVSMAGTGWSCPAAGTTCTRSDVLASGASYPDITVTVNVAANAASPLVNNVAVSGGNSAGANTSDSTVIAPPPALSITKTHTGNFMQGQNGATYTVTVSNGADAGPTSGAVTVTETLPAGMNMVSMTGTGWACPPGMVSCTRSDALAAGASYPAITVTVNVAASAASPLTNSAAVSGGGSVGANASDSTTIVPPPSLSITKTHTGGFTQGQNGATYTVTVSNAAGVSPTSGTVTVTESVPAGMSLFFMSGTGWSCPLLGTTCTRSDSLAAGASYPSITVTVNIAADAASPLVNNVTVSGGGSAAANASDSTSIILLPVLNIAKTHTGNFTQGQNGAAYIVTVSNGALAGPTSGTVTVTEGLPSALTLVSMSGTGWSCPAGGSVCTRSDVLAPGASYPPITVVVNVPAGTTSPQINQITVTGGGMGGAGGATAMDPTTIDASSPNTITAGSVTAGPGGSFSIPITLNLAGGMSANALTFGVQITPAGAAPPLAGSLSFAKDASIADGPFVSTAGTSNAISVVWASLSSPLNGTPVVGVVKGTIPASAAGGQTYTVVITGASAANGSTPVAVSPGANGAINIAANYKVGDVYPYTSDTVGNFGDGNMDILDLIQVLFAVNSVPGFKPAACSDRFDAMDLYPVDTPATRGGDGALDIRDLILELFRVNNLDMDRPVRSSLGGACPGAVGTGMTASAATTRNALPRRQPSVSGRLVLGSPDRSGQGEERMPVYLQADRDLVRVAVTFALGDQQSKLSFTPGDLRPSLVQDRQLGVVAVAWLDGVSVRAGGRVLLGYVTGPSGAVSSLKVYGVSASGLDDNREVTLTVAGNAR